MQISLTSLFMLLIIATVFIYEYYRHKKGRTLKARPLG